LDTLGVDLGSVSVKAVVLDPSGGIRFEAWRRTLGRPLAAAAGLLAEAAAALGPGTPIAGAVVTGSGKGLIAPGLGAGTINEILAHATAAWTLRPDVRTVIEIGGQDSKLIRVARGPGGEPFVEDHAFNDLCAAGTGAFLDQMAARLGVPVEDLGRLAAGDARPARMAGRCAVFAKTDLIHLRQRGCPPGEIAAGLCFALARNYLASLCRGRDPEPPVLFQGGVASNDGVARAFSELLRLREDGLVRPQGHEVMGALGAALAARERWWTEPRALVDLQPGSRGVPAAEGHAASSPRLAPRAADGARPAAHGRARLLAEECFLGLDVGSVSTKAVALARDARLLASAYLPTAGRPADAIRDVLALVGAALPPGTGVARAVATGSGRHLAQALAGADEAVDEITAQALSAARHRPDADTVFEIGGQDAKFIRMEGGRPRRFEMNRACAAGTGAFLEEQCARLGVDPHDGFERAALAAFAPVPLGSRCTVFMDSDLVHHLQQGASTGDLCAGLAYAVARNYLDRVVGSARIGERIVMQGGVARNAAVVAAIESLLGREVAVHPYPETSGAWGAALVAIDAAGAGAGPSTFRGFDGVPEVSSTTFECRACANLCEVQDVRYGAGRAFFGSVCGRFERGEERPVAAEDVFALRERLLGAGTGSEAGTGSISGTGTGGGCRIGLPQALSLAEHLPFWTTFLARLGFDPVLSGPTDREKTAVGLARVPAELCQPVKALFGHVHHLVAAGVDRVLVPHLRMFAPRGESRVRYACPYTQAAPYVARAHLPPGVEVLAPEYPVPGEDAHWARDTARALGVTEAAVREARREADAAQAAFREACVAEGRRLLDRLAAERRPGAVLIGRPYNTCDRHLTLNLARRLRALGIEPIPMGFLPFDDDRLPPFWDRVRWGFGREELLAARRVRADRNLSAVVVTNFGCGPDAFVVQYLEDELHDTPHVVLEFDDHQAEAGLLTRLEAFARTVRGHAAGRTSRAHRIEPGEFARPPRDHTYYVPRFSDHALAYTGALRSAGCRAVLLPPADRESWELGLRHAYGRECHPYISFLGDVIKASRRPGFVPAEACFYGPSYFGPCLLPQYMVAMRLVLDRVGLEDVAVVNIADPPTMAGLGKGYILRLMFGMYAIDRLFKWKTEVEPYAADPEGFAARYAWSRAAIEDGLARGGFRRAVREAVRRMSAEPLRPDAGTRPAVGVIGDQYTRVNGHANDGLYRRLREAGFEVWAAASLIDVSFLGAEQLHVELARRGKPLASVAARAAVPAVAAVRASIDRLFPPGLRTPQERPFRDVRRAADRWASYWIDKALSANLARVEELHAAGAAGVVNAMCHGCMLGNVTSALLPAMRSATPGLSSCTLIYEGLESTHNANRLEAFAERLVRSRRPG